MTPRAAFLIELLDKLGGPLMAAVESRASGDNVGESKTIAALLGQSVQLGMSLSQTIDTGDEQEADSLRVALTALSGPMIAELYRVQGRPPSEEDTKRLAKALEAVVTFAENFTPAAGHTARLKTLGTDRPLFDAAQSHIFYFSAMVPVLGAIAEFPFGQNETALVQEVAEKLAVRARSLREALSGSGSDMAEVSFTELMILHSLARVYAECHKAETKRLLDMEEPEASPSLDPVWKAFDLRLSMLETLLNVALPSSDDGPVASPVPAPPPSKAPAAAAPASQEPSAPPGEGNPMTFFSKGPADTDATPSEPPPEAAPPPASPETPPLAPPAESVPPSGEKSNPMAFFRPGAKKGTDDSE